MERVVVASLGEAKIHLLKVTGALVVFGSGIGVLDSVAGLFRLMKQLEIAQVDPEFALQVFHLPSTALSSDVLLGLMMGPLAAMLLWLALLCFGTIIYRTGGIIPEKR